MRISVYIKTEPVGYGLPPERTYTYEPEGDTALLGTVVAPFAKFNPEVWPPSIFVVLAIGRRHGLAWEPRDWARPEAVVRTQAAIGGPP